MASCEHIVGGDKVTSVFGYWPRFHDAEVVWLHLDRRGTELGDGPTVEALVHGFEMTNDVDAAGYFVLRHHVLVHFRFAGVTDLIAEDLNQQNVLMGLEIAADDGSLSVRFDSIWGVGVVFQCQTAEVVSVRPCDKDGLPV